MQLHPDPWLSLKLYPNDTPIERKKYETIHF